MKIKLDENMPRDLQTLLQKQGHDATNTEEERLSGEGDPKVLRAATKEDRVLITFDLDFADIRTYPPGSHGGIVVFRLNDQRWKTLKVPVERLLKDQVLEELDRSLAIVSETRIRIKRARRDRKERP